MNMKKIISKDSLGKLYSRLQGNYKILAPVVGRKGKAEFVYNPDYKDINYEYVQSVLSVKNLVFPKTENLMKFTVQKNGTVLHPVGLELVPETILWGSHPCDNSSFEVLRSIFSWDIDDEFFSRRMSQLIVIGLACKSSDEHCFCTSMNLSPSSASGSDLLLSFTSGESVIVEIVSPKGQSFYERHADLFAEYVDEVPQYAVVEKRFTKEQVENKLKTAFDHAFWMENSLRCIGCGTCAFVCPACACFDIQDELKGKHGRRYRTWDSCCTKLFTLHTSGHNPREVQSQRWRQRIMHKFSYMPVNNHSYGCVGCGRCTRACPVDMNISEQLEKLEQL